MKGYCVKQTRLESFLEITGDTIVGYLLSFGLQIFLVWLYDVEMSHSESAQFVGWFTVLSFVRRYVTRRIADTAFWRKWKRWERKVINSTKYCPNCRSDVVVKLHSMNQKICGDCGHKYDWPIVWEKIAYAESNDADVLLVVTNSTLSPQAVDEVNRWNALRKKPSVRFWNGTELEKRLRIYPELLVKYGLSRDLVADAATSLLPLTKILMKYSNTAAAASEFGSNVEKYYEVTHAVSELISARLEEVENTGAPKIVPFRPKDDSYVWLPSGAEMPLTGRDRYVSRALLSLLRCHGACPSRAIEVDDHIDLSLDGPYKGSESDLEKIAFWGGLRVVLSGDRNILEIYYD